MTPEFEKFVASFKPEFGNIEHIRILEMITKLKGKEKLVKEKLKSQSAINRQLTEIERAESSIIFLIKKNQ